MSTIRNSRRSTTLTDLIERLAKEAVDVVKGKFKDELFNEADRATRTVAQTLKEAYVPARKTYAMTSDSLGEATKAAHEGLYRHEVEVLTRVSAELDGIDRLSVDASHSVYRSTKRDEIRCLNAVYLHELYFSNCFDPNSELFLDALTYMRLARDWGTFEAWQADFIACAMSSRDGWVSCGYSLYLKKLINVFVDGHDVGIPIGFVPLLVIDLFEHAYYRDFGPERRDYVVAMMREIAWDVVEDRVERLEALQEIMR